MKKTKLIIFILFLCLGVFCFRDSLASFHKGDTVLSGCKPWSQKYAEIQTCILCPMFKVILKTDQSMATMSFRSLAGGFRNVVIIVLALFIAYHTLLTVSAVTKQDVGKYLQTILIQAFKVLVAVLLLTNSAHIYKYAINPLMQAGLEFGLTIIGSNVASQLSQYSGGEFLSEIPDGVISKDLLSKIFATVQLFSKSCAELPAIGSSLICVSTHTASWHGIIPDVSMMIEGLVAYAFGWCITLACCFYLLDSVVRFGIFCILLPFLIACWPFKVTFKYTKAGWDIFMNTFFNFVMMGLVISLSSELAAQALTGGNGGKEEIEALLQSANEDDLQTLKDYMSLDGTKFLVLIACCIFAFKLVQQIGELANQISQTSGPTAKNSIGGHLGGLAAQTATRVALGGKGEGGKRTGGVLGAAGKITGISGAAAGIKQRMDNRVDNVRQKFAGGGGNSGTSGGGNDSAGDDDLDGDDSED